MARLILKKSSVLENGAPKVPAPGDLEYGELAINYAVGTLYYKKSDNTIGAIGAGAAPGNGTLSLEAQAGLTNTSVSIGTGTGFSANTATNTTYQVNVGPALSALAGTMTGAGTGFLRKSGADTYTLDTNTYVTATGEGASGSWSISITGSANTANTATSAGSVSNSIIFNTTGGGPAGTTYNGSQIQQVDYSTVGAAPASHSHDYLPLTGGTLSGDVIINSSGLATSPALRINLSDSGSAFLHAQESIAANLTANQSIIHVLGVAASTKNAGYIGYKYSGTAASDNNLLTFGHWGSDHLMTLDGGGNLIITGNLTVNGTTTTINSTTVAIDDLNLQLATDAPNAAAANGAGISVGGASATFTYTSADDRWNLNKNLNVGTVYGALSGNATTATNATYLYGSTHIYVSPSNANTLNSGFGGAADGYDIWINYRGYNDNFSYYRDFRVGDGRGNEIALFTGSAQSLNVKGAITQNGNQVLHASNYSSYALPLTGGTLTGDLQVNTIRDTGGVWVLGKYNGEISLGSASAVNGIVFNSSADADFKYRTNPILHAGNYTSYTPKIVYGNSGSHNLDTVGTAQHAEFRFSQGAWGGTNPFPGNYSHVLSFNAATDNRTVQLYLGDVPGAIYWRMHQGNSTLHPWERILTSNNYGSYSPTLTGGGASGTWGINITGNAATATSATDSTKLPLAGGTMTGIITTVSSGTAINFNGQSDSFGYNATAGLGTYIKGTGSTYVYGGGSFYDGSTQRALLHAGNYTSFNGHLRALGGNDGINFNTLEYNSMYYAYIQNSANKPTSYSYAYGTILTFDPGVGTAGRAQMYVSHAGNDLCFRGGWNANDSWNTWNRVLTDQNYNSYSPTLTGGGASGTWGINITGTASGETLATVAGRGNSYGGTISIGNNGSNTGLQINHGAGNGDYGIIRFYQNGTNNQTIHVFSTSWQGGTLAGQSSGAINLAGANGVTFGSWNDLAGWIDNSGNMTIKAAFSAATKSFVIPHPTKPGKKLRYGSLEGPENGVYVRGRLKGTDCIQLPEYWTSLVDPDSITVQFTSRGKPQQLYVREVGDNCVWVDIDGAWTTDIDCYYFVQAERCDVDKLIVEE